MSVICVESRSFAFSSPIVIAGAGACGLSAALAAQEAGAEPLVIERDPRPSGSTGMSYGAICAAGSRLQRAAGIHDSAEALYEDILAITQEQTDPALARIIADNAAPAIDWLVDEIGVALTIEESWTGLGHRLPRLHAPADRSGQTLIGMLAAACAKRGIDILTSGRVADLYATADGCVLGMRIERPDGAIEEAGCEALIIATSGFGANRKMVAEFMPELRGARYHGHEGNTGDGILWGQALGGASADMGSYQALGSLAEPQALVLPHTLLIGGGVQVNAEGRRFENELEDISGQALTILEQSGGVCWMIYDQRCHEAALERFSEYRDAVAINTPQMASSWRELAALANIDSEALESTMQTVAACCRGHVEDPLGRRFDPESELVPPYFAVRVTGALFHTQGGLCVDASARVLRADGTAMPNLYAGGGAARSVSGPGGWGYLPGMGLCTALTLGRLAGYAAAKQVLVGAQT